MKKKCNRVSITVIILLGLVSLFSGLFVSKHWISKKTINTAQFHGTYLQKARDIIAFSLKDTNEHVFDNEALKGHWTFVFFGFTQCGYLCPTTMAELGKMYRLLENKGVKPLPRVVMVSIDPERDSLERLGHYTRSFQSTFFGARGDASDIKPLASALGIAYSRELNQKSNESQDYDIEHSGAIILFNPQGQVNAFFTMPHQAQLLAKDYMMLVS